MVCDDFPYHEELGYIISLHLFDLSVMHGDLWTRKMANGAKEVWICLFFSSFLVVSILEYACVSELYNHEYEAIQYPKFLQLI